jgi:hypothetical protein
MVIAKAEAVGCMNNMRNLLPAHSFYVTDRGQWPQEPAGNWGSDDAHEDWWISELMPYGLTEKSWRCPTIWRVVSSKDPDHRPRMHYSPTLFSPGANTPYMWNTQPWFIEIGNMHGTGAFICFPDGSIKTINDFL